LAAALSFLEFARNVRLRDQKDTTHSRFNIGLKTTNTALKPSKAWAVMAPTNTEKRLFQIRQTEFPIISASIFLFSGPFNGKSMHAKKTLKIISA
jgi:hypothetical protein